MAERLNVDLRRQDAIASLFIGIAPEQEDDTLIAMVRLVALGRAGREHIKCGGTLEGLIGNPEVMADMQRHLAAFAARLQAVRWDGSLDAAGGAIPEERQR